MMATRREMLKRSTQLAGLLAAAAVLMPTAHATWNKAAFDAKALADAAKALGGAAPSESADVTITGPDIAENGAVVPVGVATSLSGVKQLMILVEKNPNVLAAISDVNEAIEPTFNTRVKMGQSSNVYAVALMHDGRTLYAVKEIKVTLGGCGG
jgi:sulfur-oxidizing protein SoxY